MFRKTEKTQGKEATGAGRYCHEISASEVLTGQGMPHLDAIRQIGVTEQTYYR